MKINIHKYILGTTLLFILMGLLYIFYPKPLVSVVILTYNRAELLQKAIDSILNQTYSNFEIIIINDASTDNTLDVLKKYTDKRIRVITNKKNSANVYNRNLGFALARGKYVAWMDDDDISKPQRLEKQVKYMENHPDISILGTQISQLNSDEEIYLWPTETSPLRSEIVFLIGRIPVVLGSSMYRKSFFDEHNIRFRQEFPSPEDYSIYDQVFEKNGKIMTLPETLYEYRIHRSNPNKYYETIKKVKEEFFPKRWNRFFKDKQYPKKECHRLRYIKDNNNGLFPEELLIQMVEKHCQTDIFNPTNRSQKISFPDHTEWVIVSNNTHRFYSKHMKKNGLLISGTYEKAMVLWDGDTEPITYTEKRETSDDL